MRRLLIPVVAAAAVLVGCQAKTEEPLLVVNEQPYEPPASTSSDYTEYTAPSGSTYSSSSSSLDALDNTGGSSSGGFSQPGYTGGSGGGYTTTGSQNTLHQGGYSSGSTQQRAANNTFSTPPSSSTMPPSASSVEVLTPSGSGLPAVGVTTGSYTVRKGDTLYKIARTVYGDERRWRDIYQLNRGKLPSPDKIFVGMTLELP